MENVDPQFVIHGENGQYSYRVRCNPDCDVSLTAESGLVIEYSEDGCKTWEKYMFIGPKEIEPIARIMLKFIEGKLK